MDVIDFFQKQVNQWNADNFCDKCWNFGAPLSEAGVNEQQQKPNDKGENCCVNVIISRYSEIVTPRYAPRTGLLTTREKTFNLTIHFLQQENLGRNVYNEIDGHPITESKWATILQPLRECITPDTLAQFCLIYGFPVDITTWRMEAKIDWLDQNYTGWTIELALRLKDS